VADTDHALTKLLSGIKHIGIGSQGHWTGIFEQNAKSALTACPKLVAGIHHLLGLYLLPGSQRDRNNLSRTGIGYWFLASGKIFRISYNGDNFSYRLFLRPGICRKDQKYQCQ